jgi:hypothetical protein
MDLLFASVEKMLAASLRAAHLYYGASIEAASAGVVRGDPGQGLDVASWQIKKQLPRLWVRQFSSWSISRLLDG